jgi:hypothetical protein
MIIPSIRRGRGQPEAHQTQRYEHLMRDLANARNARGQVRSRRGRPTGRFTGSRIR